MAPTCTPYIESQELLPCQHLSEPRSRPSSWDSFTLKTHLRIKQRVASYHTTKIISHRTPKMVAMATSLSVSGPPSNTCFLGPIRAHNPNGISIGSAVFAQMTAECPYTLQWDAPSPLKIEHFHGGSGPHLIMVPWAHPSPQTKRHLDRLSRFCRAHYCYRQTDKPVGFYGPIAPPVPSAPRSECPRASIAARRCAAGSSSSSSSSSTVIYSAPITARP